MVVPDNKVGIARFLHNELIKQSPENKPVVLEGSLLDESI